MLELDGAAGGGQLLRSALSLSAVTGRAFEMTDVRGSRPTPGLKPQHLAVVETLARICDADVEGAATGSERVRFEPRSLDGGTYATDIGTAGSVPLLFDAVLPLALRLDEPLALTATGGTDVKWSPPMDALRRVKLPLVRRHGLHAVVDLDRRGFYPAGGGAATLRLAPSSPDPFELSERGPRRGVRVYATASSDLADADVAERGAEAAAEGLANEPEGAGTGSDPDREGDPGTGRDRDPGTGRDRDPDLNLRERTATYVDSESTGMVLVVRVDYGADEERTAAGFDALGEPGKPAESVADDAVEAALGFDAAGPGGAAVDRHLADQLVVPLALAGGRVAVPAVTDHLQTNVDLVEAFGFDVSLDTATDPPVAVAPDDDPA